jgi:signal transduction histidine kinase
MSLSTDIYSVFVLLLSLFTLGATFLAAYTFANTIRLRNVRLSWKAGRLFGYPLFSTLFLFFTAVVASFIVYNQMSAYYTIIGCYLWMGAAWFISSYFSSKAYITDHGIVKNINDPSQTIAWYQVDDYVEKPAEKGLDFVFIYREKNPDERKRTRFVRLELFVPDRKSSKFEKIISLKIGKTMSVVSDTSFDIKAFD